MEFYFADIEMLMSGWGILYKKSHDSSPVMTLWKSVERMLCNTKRVPCDKVVLSAVWFVSRAWRT
jgi:hypothetical protein